MTSDEFNKTAIRTEDSNRITFDVRPFKERQGEAIDSYLHEVGMQMNYGVFSTSKPIVLVCERGTVYPATCHKWLSLLLQRELAIGIEEV